MSDQERAIKILGEDELFQKLEQQDEGLISRVAGVAKFYHFCAGSVIFRQGDPPDSCYIVVTGAIEVYVHKVGQTDPPTPRFLYHPADYPSLPQVLERMEQEAENIRPLARFRCRTCEGFSTFDPKSSFGDSSAIFETGSILGELALLNDAPRASTLKCVKDCELLAIGKEDFQSVRQDLLQASETQTIDDFCTVLIEKCGSVIKAWRTVVDPHAVGELLFAEFVEALTSLQWQGNTSALWGALVRRAHSNNRDVVVGLREISPHDDRVIESYKQWMECTFGGAIELFNKLTGNRPNVSLSLSEFTKACRHHRCPQHLDLVCDFLDPPGDGTISLKDVAFLEMNGLRRKSALEPGFVMALEAAKSSAECVRRRARLQKRAQDSALTEFMRKIRSASGGSFIRGFRRILDRNGNLTISKVEMLKGCRQVAFSGDVTALWKALDRSGDGSVQLPDLDVRMALVLASFKKWCMEQHGGCVKAMQHFAAKCHKRTSKWSMDEFITAISASGWLGTQGVSLKQASAMVHEAADVSGTRTITTQDVGFMDYWEPTPWLMAEPDTEGLSQLIAILRVRYSSLIVAWKRLFDKSNKNHVTYKEFNAACHHMQVKNAPGIWRALDQEHCGYVSLKSIDHDSAQVLLNFKEWAEETFGSISFAFRVIDKDRNNAVSLPVFKRILLEFGFQGDVRTLFQSLKPDVSGRQHARDARLRLEDMKHLASWEQISDVALRELDDEVEEERLGEEAQKGEPKLVPLGESSPKTPEDVAPSPSGTSRSKLKGHSTIGDHLHFCRATREFRNFSQVRASRLSREKPMQNAFSLSGILQEGATDLIPRRRTLPKVASSPYCRPVLDLPTYSGIVDTARSLASTSKRSKMAASISLPLLQNNARQSLSISHKQGDGNAIYFGANETVGRPVLPRLEGSSPAAPKRPEKQRVALLFTGQGSHQAGMGRHLYQVDSTFRNAIDLCAEICKDLLPEDIRDIMFTVDESSAERFNSALYSQTSIFCVDYALAEMWLARGLQPYAVLGHSVGEFAAAVIAGAISVEDGLKMVTARGRLIDAKCPRGIGVMVAIFASMVDVVTALEEAEPSFAAGECAAIAAINGPEQIVVSGHKAAVAHVCQRVKAKCRELTAIPHAMHSPLLTPILEDLRAVYKTCKLRKPIRRIVSTLTGTEVSHELSTVEHWLGHDESKPVRFLEGMKTLEQTLLCGTFLEVGPQPVLIKMGSRCLPGSDLEWFASMQSDIDELESIRMASRALGISDESSPRFSSASGSPKALPVLVPQKV